MLKKGKNSGFFIQKKLNDYSYRGQTTEEFESLVAGYVGAKYCLATNTGTAALHLAYLASHITPGVEVLVPTLTFVGTVNPLAYIGATPHFIDYGEDLNIDAGKLRKYLEHITEQRPDGYYNRLTGMPIRALVAVHVLGNPCDMPALQEIASDFRLELIEDAAQAFGSTLYGRDCGTFGRCGVYSFNGNKIITTGGGGALVTDNERVYHRARYLSMVAKDYTRRVPYHGETGFNYRMSAWNAALGIKELRHIGRRLHALRKRHYTKFLMNYNIIPHTPGSNCWKTAFIGRAPEGAQPIWTLMHQLPMYAHCPRMPGIAAHQRQEISIL